MFARHAADLIDPVIIGPSAGGIAAAARRDVDVLFRVGFRPGAATPRGIAFDQAWSALRRWHPRATASHYWLGTDVYNSVNDARDGTLRSWFGASAPDLHLVTAPWHVPELAALGLASEFAPMPYSLPMTDPAPLPARFSVLTYLPPRRFAFYGGDLIFEVARRLPDIHVRVLGAPAAAPDTPVNVEYPGWVVDVAPVFAASSVVVRIPEHDGIGGTVLEGLAHARHVLYTYPLPHAELIPREVEALQAAIDRLRHAHDEGPVEANLAGRAWVLQEHDEVRLTRSLARRLCAAHAGNTSA